MNKLGLAISIAAEGFKDKTDKGGQPYILHCLRVMNSVDQNDEELKIIAVLHDVVEDGICTYGALVNFGFSDRVLYNVNLLTHDKSVDYMEYIKRIAHSSDAVKVKLADLKDNSDITRLKGLTKKDFDRMEKYHTAYTYLSNI